MKICGKTDVGRVRKTNQDAYLYGNLRGGAVWAVVCDGMGGPNGGEMAAQIAVDAIAGDLKAAFDPAMQDDQIMDLLQKCLFAANRKVLEFSRRDPSLEGMGTTVVLCVVSRGNLHVIHAGDSRLYLLYKDALRQITKDHSMVQVLVDQGEISEAEARIHPEKNLITNALGIDPDFSAEYTRHRLADEISILLCTDGLTNSLSDPEIYQILAKEKRMAEQQLDEMVETAKQVDGRDNITAVLLTAGDGCFL